MKAKHVIFYLLLVIISSSCIRDEAPNARSRYTKLQTAGSSNDYPPHH